MSQYRKFDQPANHHVCEYLRREAIRLGRYVSRKAGVVANGRYHNELARSMVVLPVGGDVPLELRALLGLAAAV